MALQSSKSYIFGNFSWFQFASTAEIMKDRKIGIFSPKTANLSNFFNYTNQIKHINYSYSSDKSKLKSPSFKSDEEILRKMNFDNFDFDSLLKIFLFKPQNFSFINEILTKII